MTARLYLLTLQFLLFCFQLPALADGALPVDGVVTSGVGWRLDPFGSGKLAFHRGVDIAVPVGTPVRATRRGRVVLAGERRGYGATVILEHDNGDRTLYGHNSRVNVRSGEWVEPGGVLAFSGNSGRSTGPHVHFEQMPSGRPIAAETTEVAVAERQRPPEDLPGREPRQLLEQRLEDSLKSLLQNIKSEITGG